MCALRAILVTVQKACYFFCDLSNLSFFSYTQTLKVWCKMYKARYKTQNGLRHVYCLLEVLLCLLMDAIVIEVARGEFTRRIYWEKKNLQQGSHAEES